MFNFIQGFITSTSMIFCILFSMGFQYGGTQHFNDIIANSVTLVDKNGFGGSMTLLNNDGQKLLMIKDGAIELFNKNNKVVVEISTDNNDRGSVSLNNGGYIETFNDLGNKTTYMGENRDGNGIYSTYNNNQKQTATIGGIDGGFGGLSIFDQNGRESLSLKRTLTSFNKDGKIVGKYGTNNSGDGYVMLYDRFGNRGWYKSGKNS